MVSPATIRGGLIMRGGVAAEPFAGLRVAPSPAATGPFMSGDSAARVAAVKAWRLENMLRSGNAATTRPRFKYTRDYNHHMSHDTAPARSQRRRSLMRLALSSMAMLCTTMLSITPAAIAKPETASITVFAAASLTDALNEAGRQYSQRSGITVRHSFASSAQIARQLAAGAPADLFIAADTEWMDYAIERKLVRAETQRVLTGNTLVVIAPATAPATAIEPARAEDWPSALGAGRLVTGDPDSVPLGRYAREALQFLGLWSQLGPRLARAENARAALALVARGEAPLGIVYASDALGEPRVRVVSPIDPRAHSAIVYPAAMVSGANPQAAAYLDFLMSTEGQKIFAQRHFGR